MVPKLAFTEVGRALGVEEVTLQRGDLEIVPDRLLRVIGESQGIALAVLPSFVNESEKRLDGLVKEIAVLRLVSEFVEIHHFEIPERLDGVALEVFLRLHREVSESRTCLEVEAEEEPVEIAEAPPGEFILQLLRRHIENAFLSDLLDVIHRLIGDVLDGSDDGKLEIFGNGKGVFMRAFIEPVEQREAIGGTGAVSMQERGSDAKGGIVATIKNLPEVKGQETALGPLHPVAKNELTEGNEEDPAGRFRT